MPSHCSTVGRRHATTEWGIWDISPENFVTLHSNLDICKNFRRIKMKFYTSIMKMLYSNSENFQNAVCVYCLRVDCFLLIF